MMLHSSLPNKVKQFGEKQFSSNQLPAISQLETDINASFTLHGGMHHFESICCAPLSFQLY